MRIWKKNQDLVLSVADTGLGMSEERLEEVRKAWQKDVQPRSVLDWEIFINVST